MYSVLTAGTGCEERVKSGHWLFTLGIKATKVLKPQYQQRSTSFLQELALSLLSFILGLKTSSTVFHSSREHRENVTFHRHMGPRSCTVRLPVTSLLH